MEAHKLRRRRRTAAKRRSHKALSEPGKRRTHKARRRTHTRSRKGILGEVFNRTAVENTAKDLVSVGVGFAVGF